MPNKTVYFLKVRNNEVETDGEIANIYECLCSSIFWKFNQAENIDFIVENADVIISEEWLKTYCKKHFNYDDSKVCSLILELMKLNLLEMGVKKDG